MAIITTSLTAGSTTATPIKLPMNYQAWTALGVACLINFSGGGPAVGTITVQVSNDPTAASSPSTARWNNHDILQGITADRNSSIVYPCCFARLTGTLTSGTVTMHIGYADTSNPQT